MKINCVKEYVLNMYLKLKHISYIFFVTLLIIYYFNLGKTCTYAIIYAKLIMSNGEDHGLHAFVVNVRDPTTMLPFTGVLIGDLGEKASLNGVDNG